LKPQAVAVRARFVPRVGAAAMAVDGESAAAAAWGVRRLEVREGGPGT
jgi:hypothetical protein